ncbi:MAG: UvrD-helicase domain-containing protein [Planctomycetota bacterium]|jgi:superfamily I DNA/RNA helicase|nr:UvrD-helicase domain-containing protein [Planctomycetota bacterium]MDP7249126.1 UvrD-helicase domain-containing protein [Planctomycetota bacterium]
MLDLNGLNPAQLSAVKQTEGPVLVLAGAGTGKTRVITYRIAHLLDKGVPPQNILAVTFTNKAAREMKERAASLVGPGAKKLLISTFHSYCVRVLREDITLLGFRPSYSIFDTGDQMSLARKCLRSTKISGEELDAKSVLHAIGSAKNRAITPDTLSRMAGEFREEAIAHIYSKYQDELKACNAVDFDDLLMHSLWLFQNVPQVLEKHADRFQYVLIDEFQDTNEVQYQIVYELCKAHRNICIVGDDDQSIYGWRGAQSSNIARFEKDFAGAKVVKLEENYRSTKAILDVANCVIKQNLLRKDKVLRSNLGPGTQVEVFSAEDERTVAESVIARISTHRGMNQRRWKDYAILFRTNSQSRVFESALRASKIPYVLIGGPSFFDRKEVRDLLGYMSALANPDDEVALFRVINCPQRGIGKTTIGRINAYSLQKGLSFHQALGQIHEIAEVKTGPATKVGDFYDFLARYRRQAETGALSATLTALIEEINYDEEIARHFPDPLEQKTRMSIVQEMINAASEFERSNPRPTFAALLQDLAIDDRDTNSDEAKDAVYMITLHSAKGLEFPYVFLAGVEEGILPHQRSISEDNLDTIEEERRLFYVGITRAQYELVMTMADVRTQFGKSMETEPSRFLSEIKDGLINYVTPDTAGPASPEVEKSYMDAIQNLLKRS